MTSLVDFVKAGYIIYILPLTFTDEGKFVDGFNNLYLTGLNFYKGVKTMDNTTTARKEQVIPERTVRTDRCRIIPITGEKDYSLLSSNEEIEESIKELAEMQNEELENSIEESKEIAERARAYEAEVNVRFLLVGTLMNIKTEIYKVKLSKAMLF